MKKRTQKQGANRTEHKKKYIAEKRKTKNEKGKKKKSRHTQHKETVGLLGVGPFRLSTRVISWLCAVRLW